MSRGVGSLRVGLSTPVVSLNPRSHNAWEVDAEPDDLRLVAEAADRAGLHHLTCSEHVAVPLDAESRRGRTYYDPLATLSWLAAVTTRIRLASHVVVLGYHHPLAVVKAWGTLDRLCGGRVILGVGVGSLAEEFALLGADFERRGPRADEAIAAIRAAWGEREPRHDGPAFPFDEVVVSPTAPRRHVPIWVGGRTRRSLRRALTLGDGWVPFGLTDDEIADAVAWGRAAGLREPGTSFEVVLSAEGLDPLADPVACRDRLEQLALLGATVVNARMVHDDARRCVEQVEALGEVAAGVAGRAARWAG